MEKDIKKIIFLILTCGFFDVITIPSFLFSQTQFQRTIGGTSNDYGWAVTRTTDGGYALCGITNSFGAGNYDMYIVKLDAGGMLQWTRTVGGTGYDDGGSLIQTPDGGYAVAGVTASFGDVLGDFFIVKLDASGTLEWTRTIGGPEYDAATEIVQTSDGGFAVAGITESFGAGSGDFCIVRLDGSGTLQWMKTIGGPVYDLCGQMIQTRDGGYALTDYTLSFGAGGSDIYIVKLDSSGAFQWNRTVGEPNNEEAISIVQSTDGGYVLAGDSFSFDSSHIYIVKFDSSGTLQWTRNVREGRDFGSSMTLAADGGYLVAGESYMFGGPRWYFVKLDGNGTVQWSKTMPATINDNPYGITRTTDGGYVVVGTTYLFGAGQRDMFIVKLDSTGNTCWGESSVTSQWGTGGTVTSPNPTVTSPNPTVTSPLPIVSSGGILTTVCVIGIQPISNEIPASFELYQNYPNPFNPTTKIKFALPTPSFIIVKIFDILGREVKTLLNEQLNPGTYEIQWDATNFPSGIYYYQLTAENYSKTKRMALIK